MSKNIVFNWILTVHGQDKKKKITDNLFPGWPDVTEMYSLPLAQSPSMLTPKPARNARHLLMLSTCKK